MKFSVALTHFRYQLIVMKKQKNLTGLSDFSRYEPFQTSIIVLQLQKYVSKNQWDELVSQLIWLAEIIEKYFVKDKEINKPGFFRYIGFAVSMIDWIFKTIKIFFDK